MKDYDIIIIGAGTAGCLIANMLTKYTKYSVIILEAGKNYDKDKAILDLKASLTIEADFGNKYFWTLGEEVPIDHDEEQEDGQEDDIIEPKLQKVMRLKQITKKAVAPRHGGPEPSGATMEAQHFGQGKLYGGSSSINGAQFVRGAPDTFQEIYNITGDKDWAPENVYKVYKKLETYTGTSSNPESRGKKGLLSVRQTSKTLMANKFTISTASVTGLNEILDYNDPNTPLGPFQQWQLTEKIDGSRASSSNTFLDPFIRMNKSGTAGYGKHRDLEVLSQCTVLKVLFHHKKATGVACIYNGNRLELHAKKKVIICAGIQSSYVLLRSGIGSKYDLRKAGINVVHDNPNVGKNLLNHPYVTVVGTANPNDIGVVDPNDIYTGGAFIKSNMTIEENKRDYEIIGFSGTNTFSLIGLLLSAKSKGLIKIINSDPLADLLFNFNYLQEESDMDKMKDVVKLMSDIINNMGDGYQTIMPTQEVLDNDDMLTDYIMHNLGQAHHWVGSCKMAPEDDGGVVNNKGHVYGVKKLIVADDSIFPIAASGNTSATAYLVGAIIAGKLIKEYEK